MGFTLVSIDTLCNSYS